MQTITVYLKGIEPHLANKYKELCEQEDTEEVQKEKEFINDLLKEIAELPAIEKGE